MQNLALEIGEIDSVEIEDAESAYPGGGQVHRDGRAETSGSNAKNARAANLLLPGQSHLGQDQMPGETPNLLIT